MSLGEYAESRGASFTSETGLSRVESDYRAPDSPLLADRLRKIELKLHDYGVTSYAHNKDPDRYPPNAELPREAKRAILAHQVLRNTHPEWYQAVIDKQHAEFTENRPTIE